MDGIVKHFYTGSQTKGNTGCVFPYCSGTQNHYFSRRNACYTAKQLTFATECITQVFGRNQDRGASDNFTHRLDDRINARFIADVFVSYSRYFFRGKFADVFFILHAHLKN